MTWIVHKTRSRNSIKQRDHEYLTIKFYELNRFVHENFFPRQNDIVKLWICYEYLEVWRCLTKVTYLVLKKTIVWFNTFDYVYWLYS